MTSIEKQAKISNFRTLNKSFCLNKFNKLKNKLMKKVD